MGKAARFLRAERYAWVTVALALLPLWVAAHVALVPYFVEDSYIHFRIAENLVATGHPYFNAGAAVKTSSSTPWTWLLALLFWISPRNLAWVAAVSALISAAGSAAWVVLLRSLVPRPLMAWESALAALVYLAVVQAASFAAMETGLALLFASAGLAAFARRKSWAFALLVAAASTRVELFALLLFCVVAAALARSMPWRRCLAFAVAAGVPTTVYDLAQYRTLVPQAAVAKPIVHQLAWVSSFGLALPEGIASDFYFRGVLYAAYGTVLIMMATLPVLRLEWSKRWADDRGALTLVIASASGFTVLATYVVSHGLIFPWYRPLYFSFLFLTGLLGAARAPTRRAYLGVAAAALPFLHDLRGSLVAAHGQPEMARHFLEGARARRTRALAAELYRDYPDAVLMTSEIGAVGFDFRGKIEDAAGLATPEALSYYPLAIPTERYDSADAPVSLRFAKDRRPGLMVAVDRHLDAVLSDALRADYVHVRHRLYEPDDDARRPSDALLWDSIRFLDVLVREDLWRARHPDIEGAAR